MRKFYNTRPYNEGSIYVVNEPKVGCHVILNSECCKSDFLGGSFTYVYTRDLKAVEYLAKLSRI
jgi:hypothetical protein